MTKLTSERVKIIRETQRVLASIDSGIEVFFNITQYTNLGLIRSRNHYGKDTAGNKIRIRTTYHLTDKGKRILNTLV